MPWLHSVTQECDFRDPWTAQDLAFHLAVQIAQELHDDFPQVSFGHGAQVAHKSKHRSSSCLHVRFAPNVSVYIGSDDELAMQKLSMSQDALQFGYKPWGPHEKNGCLVLPVPTGEWHDPQVVPDVTETNSSLIGTHFVHPFSDVQNSHSTSLEHSTGPCQQPNIIAQTPPPSDRKSDPNKWNHSIVQCLDFVDEWSALDRAYHLAVQVAQELGGNFAQIGSSPTASTKTSGSKRSSRHVSFCPSVLTIWIQEDAIDTVHCEPLRNPTWNHDANPYHTNIDGRTFHVPPVCATCFHHCDRFTMHRPHTAVLPSHLKNDVRRTSSSSRQVTLSMCRTTQSPQIAQPRYAPRPAQRPKHPLTFQVKPMSCRLDHESPIAEFAAQMPNAPQQAGNNQNVPNPQPPMQPAFVDDLSTRFLRMGYDIFDGDFDVPVRTWYIDHATIRRWTAPRNLQLVGPPQGWEAQFSSIWVDQINPDEWFDVTVIHPDPPRSPRNSFLIMDLVITQSLQLDRFAGLVTVFPNNPGAFDMFSVAASFEPHVSGFEIALAADAADMCRYQECTVTFGWQDIPFTLRPHHVMANGDGFQVTRHHPARLATSSGSQAGSSTNSTTSQLTAIDEEVAAIPAQQNHTMPTNRFTTPLHLFQMDGPEVVMQLVNAQLAQPSHEMANALHVPLNCIEALHVMPIPPDGFPELAIPAIVQRVGDIDLHSMDRLILIDTIYHHHITEGVANQPTVVRTVQRVTHQVTRQQILFKAAVYHYCQFLQEGCAVSLDGYLWPINHVDPRPVTHGSYATVDVPPPYGHNLDTHMVATQLHVDGTTDAMMTFLQEPDETRGFYVLDAVICSQNCRCIHHQT